MAEMPSYNENTINDEPEQLCLNIGGVVLEPRPQKTREQKVIEAVLFTLSRPVSTAELAKACRIDIGAAEREIKQLKKLLDDEKSALIIKDVGGKYQMCTSPEYFDNLVRVVSSPKKPELTEVMMETLAIIANKNPSTKAEIEKIRGVKSDFAVNKLIEYGLVEEKGRLNAPGKPILFGPTDEFYRRFGVDRERKLPSVSADIESRINEEVQVELKDILGTAEEAEETSDGANC